MADKLIAIIRFKTLSKVPTAQRFEVRESAGRLCGPAGAAKSCAFFGERGCAGVICEVGERAVYFTPAKSKPEQL